MDYDFVVWFLESGCLSENEINDFKRHHNYTFASYDRFKNFADNGDNKYEIKVYVQLLHNVLKQKSAGDQYFSKNEFIDLIKKKKIIFEKPSKSNHEISNSEFLVDITSYSEDYDLERQKKLPQVKKHYWKYVKKQLFGDPNGTVKGLLDITKPEENDIKKILSQMLVMSYNDG